MMELVVLSIRAKAKELRAKLRFGSMEEPVEASAVQGDTLVARVLFVREQAGKTTTFRQLHQLAQISQPAALRIIADMERSGQVTIEEELHDTFESAIVLSSKIRATMRSNPVDDAARGLAKLT